MSIPEFADPKIVSEAPPISEKAHKRSIRRRQKEEKQHKRSPKPVQPRNKNQSRYIKSLRANELTIAVGPAGVGKTYLPARVYGEMLMAGEIDVIYCARPNISKPQHRQGFLPGGLKEKNAPWMVPIYDGLRDAMSPAKFASAERNGMILEVPFEHMQGRTFRNCAAIIDEAENCDLDDLYITLTRQGDNCFMAMSGDLLQARIHNSGLGHIVKMADYDYMKRVGIVEFTAEDVVRSAQARMWVKAFADRASGNNLHESANRDMSGPEDFYKKPPKFLGES
jgi:phosphate starvation-inducible PhoH-like protein